MKKLALSLVLLCAAATVTLFAQSVLADDNFSSLGAWRAAHGTWKADGTLTQSNVKTGLARIDRGLPQSGVIQVEFTAKYLDGGYADMKAYAAGPYHGGFGIHIGVDKPAPGMAWGNGKSYLLWLNFDTTVPRSSEHYGLRAQVYESKTNSRMNLVPDSSVEILPLDIVAANLSYLAYALPVKMVINTNDGEIRVYDPTVEDYYYYFYLDPKLLKGAFVSFRTNRVSMAFDDFKVTKLR